MATPYIVQNGTVFSRKTSTAATGGAARIPLTSGMVGANLVATVDTTTAFEAILDDQGTYWRLRDRDVVYGEDNVKINLYSIYKIRGMITHEASITIRDNSSNVVMQRHQESDSLHGFAWRKNDAVVYTRTPVASNGMPWYSDSALGVTGGTVTAVTNPTVTSAYQGGWQAVFCAIPNQLSYTTVTSSTYGASALSDQFSYTTVSSGTYGV